MVSYKYAIRKIEKRNGGVIYIPLAKIKDRFSILNEWQRIVKLYQTYDITSLHLETDFKLTYEDCIEHISEFQKTLEVLNGEDKISSELILEEDERYNNELIQANQ